MQMEATASGKRAVLKQTFGFDAFREGQEPLIDALLSGRDALGVMPTGAGKSLCYQIPALLVPGVTLVVSPLISLMKDQVMALVQSGVKAAYMNSSLRADQYATVLRRAADGWYRIIYVAPERLDTPEFLRFALAAPVSALIVDEAHCISQWGQDFRPSYLKIADFVAALPKRPVVGAFTATATQRVKRDIVERLGLQSPLVVTTGFDRPNLFFAVWRGNNKDQALSAFLEDKRDRSGIVYCATRKGVEEVCTALCRDGYAATRYHAGLSDEERRANQDDFQCDRRPVMVATNAFGMGIDKSNVSYVVHYNMPKNLESYYQEAGRAGRDGEKADCLLLYSKRDVITAQWLIEHGGENPELTAEERRVIEANEREKLKWMTFYATADDCLRNRILKYFGEYREADCGNCGSCRPEALAILSNISADARKPRKRATVVPPRAASYHDRPDPAAAFALPAAAGARSSNVASDEMTAALLTRLKALRLAIANERHVYAYMVFTDATLAAMAEIKPTRLESLGEIIGVGAAKKERFGKAFVSCIRECIGLPPDEPVDASPAPRAKERPARKRATGAKARAPQGKAADAAGAFDEYRQRLQAQGVHSAYEPWTEREDHQLQAELRIGLSVGQIAEVHARTQGAIRARIKKLEL